MCDVRFQFVGDHAPSRLDLLDEPAALLDLFQYELDRDVQDVALGTALALQAGHDGRHLVETVTDGLTALLFLRGMLASRRWG